VAQTAIAIVFFSAHFSKPAQALFHMLLNNDKNYRKWNKPFSSSNL
jgi:hypothetical protein